MARKLNFSDDFKERGKTVGVTEIGNFVRGTEWGKTAYKVRVKPMMSEKNIRDRRTFCARMMHEEYSNTTQAHLNELTSFLHEEYCDTTQSHLNELTSFLQMNLQLN